MNAWTLMETFTFPGWPEVAEPSMMHLFLLTIAGPLLVGALVTVFFLGRSRHGEVVAEERSVGLVDDPDRPALRRAASEHGALDSDVKAGQDPANQPGLRSAGVRNTDLVDRLDVAANENHR